MDTPPPQDAPPAHPSWACKARFASVGLVALVVPAQYLLLELTQIADWPEQMGNLVVAGMVVIALVLLDAVAFLVWAMLPSRRRALLALPALLALASILVVLCSAFMPFLQS